MRKFFYQNASPDRYQLLKEYAKKNRANPTEAESLMWRYLNREDTGLKWRRQHIIGDYIADFVCLSERLIIEIDGGYHFEREQEKEDAVRSHTLEAMGFKVIRFSNEEVFEDIDYVLQRVLDIIDDQNN